MLAIGAVIGLAMGVQTALGFGAILVSVTLGAHLLPLDRLLPLIVPVSLVQSSVIAVRHRSHVQGALLLRRVLPLVAVGLGVGVVLVGPGQAPWLRPALGVLVLGLAALSLTEDGQVPEGGGLGSAAALVAGGFVQGLLATGGPLVVWGLARHRLDRHALRATLAVIWLSMNVVLVGAMVADGRIDGASLGRSAALLVPAAAGLGVGELVHGRLPERGFRRAVWVLLGLAAFPLLLGG
ncbi:MAG: TSUP family transporter [Myxococcota bacterium]